MESRRNKKQENKQKTKKITPAPAHGHPTSASQRQGQRAAPACRAQGAAANLVQHSASTCFLSRPSRKHREIRRSADRPRPHGARPWRRGTVVGLQASRPTGRLCRQFQRAADARRVPHCSHVQRAWAAAAAWAWTCASGVWVELGAKQRCWRAGVSGERGACARAGRPAGARSDSNITGSR